MKTGEKYINKEKVIENVIELYTDLTCLFVKYKIKLSAGKKVDSAVSLKYSLESAAFRLNKHFIKCRVKNITTYRDFRVNGKQDILKDALTTAAKYTLVKTLFHD